MSSRGFEALIRSSTVLLPYRLAWTLATHNLCIDLTMLHIVILYVFLLLCHNLTLALNKRFCLYVCLSVCLHISDLV